MLANVKECTEIAHNITVTFAAIAGGVWTIVRFVRERTYKAAVTIATSEQSIRFGEEYLVFVSARLANKGRSKIQAQSNRNKNGYAFEDPVEKLRHGCLLELKKLLPGTGNSRWIDWLNVPGADSVAAPLGEINLLSEYELREKTDRVDFWMEADEEYELQRAANFAGRCLHWKSYVCRRSKTIQFLEPDFLPFPCRRLPVFTVKSRRFHAVKRHSIGRSGTCGRRR